MQNLARKKVKKKLFRENIGNLAYYRFKFIISLSRKVLSIKEK